MDRKVLTREKELEKLLREVLPFIKSRGTYWYNTQRRGPAADLVGRIEKAIGFHDENK